MRVRNINYSNRSIEKIIKSINSLQLSVIQVQKQLFKIEDTLNYLVDNMNTNEKDELKGKINQWVRNLPHQ